MPKLSFRDAVSRAAAKALDAYYQSVSGGREAELAGRLFEAYLNRFRQIAWAAESADNLALAVEAVIGPLPDWVKKDLL